MIEEKPTNGTPRELTAETHPFLEGFDPDFLKAASENTVELSFLPNDMIFQAGERARHFYLILEGKVALEVEAPDHPRFTLQTVGPRDVMGWAWLVPPYRWPIDARAVKATRTLALDTLVLHRYFKIHTAVGYRFVVRLLSVIAQRLDETRLQMVDLHDD